MTHLSNKREKHTYLILAHGEIWAEITCSANRIASLVRQYRKALACEITVRESHP